MGSMPYRIYAVCKKKELGVSWGLVDKISLAFDLDLGNSKPKPKAQGRWEEEALWPLRCPLSMSVGWACGRALGRGALREQGPSGMG
jgi:hypothetical protein